MFLPPTVTARDSFRRRRPPHSGQGHSLISSSSSFRLASDWVSFVAALNVVADALKGLLQNALAARLVIVQLQQFALGAVEDDVLCLAAETVPRLRQENLYFLLRASKYIREMPSPRTLFQPLAQIAPSRMDLLPSGTMMAGSAFNWLPRPVQVGQAPKGLLKENIRGSAPPWRCRSPRRRSSGRRRDPSPPAEG